MRSRPDFAAESPLTATPDSNGQPSSKRWRRIDVLAAAGFVAYALVFVWPVLLGRVPVASDTLYLWAPLSQVPHAPVHTAELADSGLLFLPWTVFARDAVASGEWPLWDPYSFSGFPFAANSQSQIYYPLTWLLWLLPLSGHIQVLSIFNIWLAGMGTYAFARRLDVGPLPAFVAGAAFAGSGIMQLTVELWGVSSVYGWLPWILYAADRALEERHPGWSATAGGAVALQCVAGHIQYVAYTLFVLAVWVVWRMATRARSGGLRLVTEYAIRAIAIVAAGVGVAAVHLAPLFELSALSNRAGVRTSSNSPPLYSLLRSLMPEYFGARGVGAPLVFNDLWYAGVSVLLLAALALLLRPRSSVWLWLGLALVAIAVAYGIGPFLYVRWLPGLSGMLPIRIGYVFVFALAMMSALGLEGWIRRGRSRPGRAALLLLAPAAIAGGCLLGAQSLRTTTADLALRALQGEQILRAAGLIAILLLLLWIGSTVRSPSWTTGAVVAGVLVLDLATAVPGYNSFVLPGEVIPSSPALRWLQDHSANGRVLGRGVDNEQPVLVPNMQSLYGIQSVAGYDSLHTRDYEDFWAAFDASVNRGGSSTPYSNVFVRPQSYTSTAASLLGVRYIASSVPLTATGGLALAYDGEIRIYEQSPMLPRAFFIARAEVLDSEALLGRMSSVDFDPRTTVLLNSAETPEVVDSSANAGIVPASITGVRRNSLEVAVQAPAEGWLILGDANYPGWTATVNGAQSRVYSAYLALRAVRVPAGKSNVKFTFAPSSIAWSWSVTAISLLTLAAGTAMSMRTRVRLHQPSGKSAN